MKYKYRNNNGMKKYYSVLLILKKEIYYKFHACVRLRRRLTNDLACPVNPFLPTVPTFDVQDIKCWNGGHEWVN